MFQGGQDKKQSVHVNKAYSRFQSTQACTGLKCAAKNWKTLASLKLVPVCAVVSCHLSIPVLLHRTI